MSQPHGASCPRTTSSVSKSPLHAPVASVTLKNDNGEDNWVGSGKKNNQQMIRKNKKGPVSSFEISEHLLDYRTGETNPMCNWKAGEEGRGLKINKKVLWDYFRTHRADQRVKCETAQRARFGYIHDVSLGKERLQGPRSALLSAPTQNTLSSSPLLLPAWKIGNHSIAGTAQLWLMCVL